MAGVLTTRSFSDRVAILFVAQTTRTVINIFNAFFFASLLGPAGKGDYYILTLVPLTIVILIQLGLPPALGFYAARGKTHRLVARSLLLSAVISSAAFLAAVAMLPLLQATIMRGISSGLIVCALATIPMILTSTFMADIVTGRRAFGWWAAVGVAQSATMTVLLGLTIGVFGLAVPGAVVAFLLGWICSMVALIVGAARVSAAVEDPGFVTFRGLFRYGLPLYPGSITTFLSYRADVFVLAALMADPAVALGYYSMAVSVAELAILLPDAVSTVFFPDVAASSTEESGRRAPALSRATLVLTAATALGLAPIAAILFALLLPAFVPALPALLLLLPGVVALGVSKVVTGYFWGLGRTGVSSAINVGAFILNISLNLILIPRLGILGASASSLISYSAAALVGTVIAARLSGSSFLDFWLPRRSDLTIVSASLLALARRMAGRTTPRV